MERVPLKVTLKKDALNSHWFEMGMPQHICALCGDELPEEEEDIVPVSMDFGNVNFHFDCFLVLGATGKAEVDLTTEGVPEVFLRSDEGGEI